MAKKNANKRYDREFKLGAVKLVLDEGRSYAQVAEALGASEPSVRQWVHAYKRDNASAFPGSCGSFLGKPWGASWSARNEISSN